MFFASSKRALSSTTAVTCLPARAARDERVDDRGVVPGAVERDLDREHLRVVGAGLHEARDGIERVERVVEQEVLLAQAIEELGALGRPRGLDRLERRELEVGRAATRCRSS